MALYAGLDVGTTTLGMVVLDSDTNTLVTHQSVPNKAMVRQEQGISELDLTRLYAAVIELLRDTARELGTRSQDVVGLGVTPMKPLTYVWSIR